MVRLSYDARCMLTEWPMYSASDSSSRSDASVRRMCVTTMSCPRSARAANVARDAGAGGAGTDGAEHAPG